MALKLFNDSVPDELNTPREPTQAHRGDDCPRDRPPHSERALAALAVALGACSVDRISRAEAELLADLPEPDPRLVREARDRIEIGEDPLGEAFCTVRSSVRRRRDGAIYTPPTVVNAMLSWAETAGKPNRVVDPGAGSGRFLLEAGHRFPRASLVAIEPDPLAALTIRANLAVRKMAGRAVIRVDDFRRTEPDNWHGKTLYIGNPPYIRHHLIGKKWKAWLKREAGKFGFEASALAGLYVYFFLTVAAQARPGDYGALVTPAEWLDVNYGQLVRDLFLDRLGGQSVTVVRPEAQLFPGIQTTSAITTFTVASRPTSVRFGQVGSLAGSGDLSKGRHVERQHLRIGKRWSTFTRSRRELPEGFTELGEFCRVHRGQVTGANRIWIAGEHSQGLPAEVLFPTVTRAVELFKAGWQLADTAGLRLVIDLPQDLERFGRRERTAIESFLARAEEMGARDSYTARHRPRWWSVRLRAPAPILATYMARQPPAFVLNRAKARHLNIAHGLYPRQKMSGKTLAALVRFLRDSATTEGGRKYAGGLTKYEPSEMERIPVPEPSLLLE